MLMRTDPFRDLDRFTQQVLGTAARPAVMPMDAWREGDAFFVEFDLPGIDQDSLDLDIERNVVTVRAQRPAVDPNREMLATERPRGVFSRQLVLGENLDTERIEATYREGVLRLQIPVAERAKPRKIAITTREVIDA
jgi:HSP20 family protein